MSKLFEKTSINGMELANRFVRSATWESKATKDGMVTPELIDSMTKLAKGGVGLIVSGHAYVRPDGHTSLNQLSVCEDEHIPGLRKMCEAVHKFEGKIILQLAHAGTLAREAYSGQKRLVVSEFEGLDDKPGREITKEVISEIVNDFANAALRAKKAGFDGVQVHAAHGYLLSQFLSPYYNRRTDSYGGSVANRVRIHIAILQAIRKKVGDNFPVLIKFNGSDYHVGGLDSKDSVQAAKLLELAGFDAIELSGGNPLSGTLTPIRMGINNIEKEAYFKEEAKAIRKEIKIPLILVGGNRSYEVAEQIFESGLADYISMCRPFICEPDLINRWKSGDTSKSKCKSDNLCFRPAYRGEGVYCVTWMKEKGKE